MTIAVLACTLERETQPAHEPVIGELVDLLEKRPALRDPMDAVVPLP
jgi:hypothetical protein